MLVMVLVAFIMTRVATTEKMCVCDDRPSLHDHPEESDEITELPGMNFNINFRHYAGYLDATDDRHFFYWFVESQSDPANDPLVLWLNGGPGCSSMLGMLGSIGPFQVSQDGKTLMKNKYTWNKVANLLFMDSPAGTGFSYKDDKNYTTNDDQTADDNLSALKNFFRKYPQFRKNDFYMAGEAYAGVYLPMLALRILHDSRSINLKGIAIGNGYLDVFLLNAQSLIFWSFYHSLFGRSHYEAISSHCCDNNVFSPETCNFDFNPTDKCIHATESALETLNNLDQYNIYHECQQPSMPSNYRRSRYFIDRQLRNNRMRNNLIRPQSASVPSSNNTSNSDLKTPPGYYCPRAADFAATWLEQDDVRNALHIPETVQNWYQCSDEIFESYGQQYLTMRPQINEILRDHHQHSLKVMVYNGDADSVCNALGDEWFVDSLNLTLIRDRRPWKYFWKVASEHGGFIKNFDRLDYVTIRGAGHVVPNDKPAAALKLIKYFLGIKQSLD